jgi:hypothetical protein
MGNIHLSNSLFTPTTLLSITLYDCNELENYFKEHPEIIFQLKSRKNDNKRMQFQF